MDVKIGEGRDVVDSVPVVILSATNQEEQEVMCDNVERVPYAARALVIGWDKTDDEGDCVDGIPDMILPVENSDEKEENCYDVDGVPFEFIRDVKSTTVDQQTHERKHHTHVNIQNEPYQNNYVDSLVPSYKMDHLDRGYFVIFNQQNFAIKDLKLEERKGTMIDVSSLEGMAKVLGFDKDKIIVHTDLTRKEITACIEDYANKKHREHDCFVCVVLTHGQRLAGKMSTSFVPSSITVSKELLYAKDGTFELADLKKPFEGDKCASLAGKPKLFFVQGCRGQGVDTGVIVPESGDEEQENLLQNSPRDTWDCPGQASDDTRSIETKIPVEADFLFGHCTAPEYFAWRSNNNGSPYIQRLCECFSQYGRTHDVEQILKLVSHKVAHVFESETLDEKTSKKKQMPVFTSQLTKRLCFTGRTETE